MNLFDFVLPPTNDNQTASLEQKNLGAIVRVVSSLLNRSEEVVWRELNSIAADNGLKVFSKTRLSDVLVKGSTILSKREFDFFTRAHCDFVVTDEHFSPLMIVEYDGPLHEDQKQTERDEIKNRLCKDTGLGLLRINDKHVTRLYRGMTVLRWIVEVTELQKSFWKAQEEGHVPEDEPFDPAMVANYRGVKWPYWLSIDATQSFHSFFEKLPRDMPKGWTSILGSDQKGTDLRLSCLYFGERILFAKTAVRNQDLDFPHYDLLNELGNCELGIQLRRFQAEKVVAVTKGQYEQIFKDFCNRYDARPSHSMGGFPFDVAWKQKFGWKFSNG